MQRKNLLVDRYTAEYKIEQKKTNIRRIQGNWEGKR